jgi:3-phosphoinositide dependent protein kinase-1
LGIGSYSTVVYATDKQTLRQYAIKILNKQHIIREKSEKYVTVEKLTLNRLGKNNHHGIIKLYYTFQDKNSLYFVLDYATHGELLSLIKRMGTLDENCVRYFGAQILDAIDFMHKHGVIHRDLKPENILLDDKMRVKITDFGTAKLLDQTSPKRKSSLNDKVSSDNDQRAMSFVGTAEYVSPELLNDKSQGKPCDIWAYGCIIYQLLAGRPPFQANNDHLVFTKIVKLQFAYPPRFPAVLRDLIKHLLVLDPNRRWLIPQIKNHEFFASVEWTTKGIWNKKPPRFQPFKESSSANGNSVKLVNGLPVFNSRPVNPAQRASEDGRVAKSTSPGTALTASQSSVAAKNGGVAAAAAAALAKSPKSITPYHTPVQQPRQPLPFSNAVATGAEAKNQEPRTALPASSSANGATASKRPTGFSRVQSAAKTETRLGLSHSRSNARLVPVKSEPKLLLDEPVDDTSPPSSEATTPSNITTVPVERLDLPEKTPIDQFFANVIQIQNERVLYVNTVTITTTNHNNSNSNITYTDGSEVDDDYYGPSSPLASTKLSKIFSSLPRKKKRVMLVTTSGRLLILSNTDLPSTIANPLAPSTTASTAASIAAAGNTPSAGIASRLFSISGSSTAEIDRRHIHYEIMITNPLITIREYPFNRRTRMGVLSIQTETKIHTVEDPAGTSEWMEAFRVARDFVRNSEEIMSSYLSSTAAAAAVASTSRGRKRQAARRIPGAGLGQGSGGGGANIYYKPSSSFVRRSFPEEQLQLQGSGPGLPLKTAALAGGSSMLQRNEERKMLRRGLAYNM